VAAGFALARWDRIPEAQSASRPALCGIVGLKTDLWRVSRMAFFPFELVRSITSVRWRARWMDAALMLQVIAGHDRHDPTTRTAVVPDYSVR